MSSNPMADVRGAVESLPDECSTSTSSAHVTEASYEPSTEKSESEAMQDLQTALKSRIQELELAEAEEKEISKACKKVMREAQKFISNKEHTVAQKLEFLQQKFMDRVNEHMKSEKTASQLQKRLDKTSAERAALSDEVRKLKAMTTKLQDLCRTLQAENKTVVQEAHAKVASEAQQREELSQRMALAMQDISTRLEEHSEESQKCIEENTELRSKLEKVGRFCEEMEQNYKEQLERKDAQISFLEDRIHEQTEILEHYSKTERILQEKCEAAEAARESYAKQLENARQKIDGFCDSFEKSNSAFKTLQEQVDVSHKIQKKMQQESDLLKKRSELVQQNSERCVAENQRLLGQMNEMRRQLEQSIPIADHNRLRAQKVTLERLCRVLQAEVVELRKRLPELDQDLEDLEHSPSLVAAAAEIQASEGASSSSTPQTSPDSQDAENPQPNSDSQAAENPQTNPDSQAAENLVSSADAQTA